MIVLKGDTVRTYDGQTGEIVDVWGHARTLCRLKLSSGQTSLIFEADVAEILRRHGKSRERRW